MASKMRFLPLISMFLLLATVPGAGQNIEGNLAYGPDPYQVLDLIVPETGGFPTVIFIHGGSLSTGDKADEDYRSVGVPFRDAGIACASINYRLAPKYLWPAQAEDVAAAAAWIRKNIGRRGGDPSKIFLFGHSSGAALAALVGSDERFLAKHGLKLSDLAGVMPMGSVMWDDDLEQALEKYGRARIEESFLKDPENRMFGDLEAYLNHWPIRHVIAGLPPFLFLIAESEQEQPPVLKTCGKFAEESRRLGNEAEIKILAGRTHYSAIRNLHVPGDEVFQLVRDFVRRIRAT